MDDISLIDTDKDIWLKCDECGLAYHKSCWDNIGAAPNQVIYPHFVCCKYNTFIPVYGVCVVMPLWCGGAPVV